MKKVNISEIKAVSASCTERWVTRRTREARSLIRQVSERERKVRALTSGVASEREGRLFAGGDCIRYGFSGGAGDGLLLLAVSGLSTLRSPRLN